MARRAARGSTVASMPFKHAVLALVAERPGYGYDLARRFEERVGPGWRLNASAVYPALDQLEREGLVVAEADAARRPGGTRRSPRVVYAPTAAAEDALERWRHARQPLPEPVRSELHLKLAFAHAPHYEVLRAELAAHERAAARLLARCAAATPARADPARRLLDAAVAGRLEADLAWLRDARAALGAAAG